MNDRPAHDPPVTRIHAGATAAGALEEGKRRGAGMGGGGWGWGGEKLTAEHTPPQTRTRVLRSVWRGVGVGPTQGRGRACGVRLEVRQFLRGEGDGRGAVRGATLRRRRHLRHAREPTIGGHGRGRGRGRKDRPKRHGRARRGAAPLRPLPLPQPAPPAGTLHQTTLPHPAALAAAAAVTPATAAAPPHHTTGGWAAGRGVAPSRTLPVAAASRQC